MKNLFGAGGISHQTGRIAGTSLCLPNRNGAASASLDCGNHFAHGITRSSSKIESSALPTVKNVGESEVVRRGQICYVGDRKSTRLNSSHVSISYAVFCLKKKNRVVK